MKPTSTPRSAQPVHRGSEPFKPAFVPFQVVSSDKARDADLVTLAAAMPRLRQLDRIGTDFARIVESLIARQLEGVSPRVAVIHLASGSQLHIDLRDRFAATILYGYLAEASDLNVFCRLVEAGSCVVDVGANFGLYAVEAARLAGPTGRVIAFEPVPHIFDLLETNIAVNGIAERVVARSEAVAQTSGRRPFNVTESASFSGFTDTKRSPLAAVTEVECVTLDETEELSEAKVDLLKIDVEGAELNVLKGARQLLKRSEKAIIQLEITTKNLDNHSRNGIIRWLLRQIENGGVLRTGFHDSTPGRRLESGKEIGVAMNGNFFLAQGGGDADARLQEAFRKERGAVGEEAGLAPSDADLVRIFVPRLNAEIRETAHLGAIAEKHKKSVIGFEHASQREAELERSLTRAEKKLEVALRREAALNEKLATNELRLNAALQRRAELDQTIADLKQELASLSWVIEQRKKKEENLVAQIADIHGSTWWRIGALYVFPPVNLLKRRRH